MFSSSFTDAIWKENTFYVFISIPAGRTREQARYRKIRMVESQTMASPSLVKHAREDGR